MTRLPHKFGRYGGQFVPETLVPALDELEAAYLAAQSDPHFRAEYERLLAAFVGRPTPVTYAARSIRICAKPSARFTLMPPTAKRSTPFRRYAGWRALSPRSSPRTPWPRPSSVPLGCARIKSCS